MGADDLAIASADRHMPDLLIVDAMLRDGVGIDAVDPIERRCPMPPLFLTADRLAVRGGVKPCLR